MRKIEVFTSDNGNLERDFRRAKAHDIAYAFERRAKDKAVGTSSNGTSRIDWGIALHLLENWDILKPHLDDFEEWLEADKMEREVAEAAMEDLRDVLAPEIAEAKFYSNPDETVEIGNGTRGPMIPVAGRYRESDDPGGMKPYLDEAKDRIAKREVFIPKETPYQDDRGKWIHGKPRPDGGWDPV